jgi:hypothetical protein
MNNPAGASLLFLLILLLLLILLSIVQERYFANEFANVLDFFSVGDTLKTLVYSTPISDLEVFTATSKHCL